MKINKDQLHIGKLRKIKFDYKRGSGHMLAYLINRFKWHYYPRVSYVSEFPCHVDVEISSACNMKCPMCYTTGEEFTNRVKQKFMDFNLFKKVIDECVKFRTYSIRISLRGEPFIHKDVIAMIRYAKEKGIKEVSSLTNNLALTPDLFTQALRAGLDWLTISFDGLSDTYESIRYPAKFDESYQKIKEYKRIKNLARMRKPVIRIQTVWPAIKSNAKHYFDTFYPYADDIAINPLVDYLHKDTNIVYEDKFTCPVLYQRMCIGSDGISLLCSNDEFCLYPLGDANKESLYDMWHGEKISQARQIHKEGKGTELLAPCKHCYLPRKIQPVIEQAGNKTIVIEKYINRPDEIGK